MTSAISTNPKAGSGSSDGGTAPNEVRVLTAWAFEELRGATGGIRDMHLAIAQRAFRGVAPAGRPIQVVHDAVSRGVYAALAAGTSGLSRLADRVIVSEGIGEHMALSGTRRGSAVIGALNGLLGERFDRSGDLCQAPSVRVQGEAVELDAASLGASFPDATGRIAVFLHGLMGTELYWESAGEGGTRESYGARLASDLDYTPVYLRYDSGRHVSENGRSIAALLELLAEEWPVEVHRIALIGHSMGGLVARSACHYGSESAHRWPERVTHVVTLGTPHLGAPGEQALHLASAALAVLPETRPLGSLLRHRSAGIRDLRQGSLVDEDWRGRDPDALRAGACREVPMLEGATHCFVAATISRGAHHPVGRLLGDMLVLTRSARGGRMHQATFADEHEFHIGRTHHLALLHSPQLYERLRHWLESGRPLDNSE